MPYAHFFFALSSHVESLIINGGYPLLFLLVILESVPLIGTAIPGHVTIIAAGFLAKVGIFNRYWVLTITVVAALLGDYIGFALGRRYGMSLIDRLKPYFFIKDSHIVKAKALLDSHTGKAMFLGRFSPVTRALMPFLVGTGEIPIGRFWLFNLLSCVTWVVASVLLGYIFGAGYHLVSGYVGKFALIGIGLAILIIWGYRFINQRFEIFAKYELFALGLNIASLIILTKTIQDAWAEKSFLANFDITVSVFADKFNHAYPFLADVAVWITNGLGTAVMLALGVILGAVLLIKRRWRMGAIFLISTGATAFSLGLLKEFFLRARPDNALITLVNDPSFPSGHAAMAASFFVVLAYFVLGKISARSMREIALICMAGLAILVGLTRLVLNVHWFSDVMAGWSLGIFIATGSILFVRYAGTLITRKKSS